LGEKRTHRTWAKRAWPSAEVMVVIVVMLLLMLLMLLLLLLLLLHSVGNMEPSAVVQGMALAGAGRVAFQAIEGMAARRRAFVRRLAEAENRQGPPASTSHAVTTGKMDCGRR
jgi:hypothetical protein